VCQALTLGNTESSLQNRSQETTCPSRNQNGIDKLIWLSVQPSPRMASSCHEHSTYSRPVKRHRFPAEIISHGVWLYFRFCLSRVPTGNGMAQSFQTWRAIMGTALAA
jgi:hypothetical protein